MLLQFSHPSGSVGLPHFPARFSLSVKFLSLVEAVLVLDLVMDLGLGVNVIHPPNPALDFLEFCWSERFLPFYISRLVGQVF